MFCQKYRTELGVHIVLELYRKENKNMTWKENLLIKIIMTE